MRYDFVCTKCKKEQEHNIPMAEYNERRPFEKCFFCGAEITRKSESISGVVYKASGFYDTDVRGVSSR